LLGSLLLEFFLDGGLLGLLRSGFGFGLLRRLAVGNGFVGADCATHPATHDRADQAGLEALLDRILAERGPDGSLLDDADWGRQREASVFKTDLFGRNQDREA